MDVVWATSALLQAIDLRELIVIVILLGLLGIGGEWLRRRIHRGCVVLLEEEDLVPRHPMNLLFFGGRETNLAHRTLIVW